MNKTAYLAGPMTGIPMYNFPAFDAARDRLLAQGWQVVSPADLDRAHGFDPVVCPYLKVTPEFLRAAMKRDVDALLSESVTAIYLLDGWEKSAEAQAEFAVAEWRGLEVMYEKPVKVAESATISNDSRNPKDIAGSKKCPMHLLPPVAMEKTAWAHQCGAGKYGPYNWRDKKISASQYVAAVMRHLNAWHNGQNDDSESGLSHLAHVGATVNILMDAEDNECLIDDRPLRRPWITPPSHPAPPSHASAPGSARSSG